MKEFLIQQLINTFGKHYSNNILNTVLGIIHMEFYTPNFVITQLYIGTLTKKE